MVEASKDWPLKLSQWVKSSFFLPSFFFPSSFHISTSFTSSTSLAHSHTHFIDLSSILHQIHRFSPSYMFRTESIISPFAYQASPDSFWSILEWLLYRETNSIKSIMNCTEEIRIGNLGYWGHVFFQFVSRYTNHD